MSEEVNRRLELDIDFGEVVGKIQADSWVNTYNFLTAETTTILLNMLDEYVGEPSERIVANRSVLEDALWTYLSSGHLETLSVGIGPEDAWDEEFRISVSVLRFADENDGDDDPIRSPCDRIEKLPGFDDPTVEVTLVVLEENEAGKTAPRLEEVARYDWLEIAERSPLESNFDDK